ncbi:MAG: recombination regulator RecX [Methylobacteriaceae bacterium]|nr:recombination regulator RecX [Methylobacteriaceae bacterium]
MPRFSADNPGKTGQSRRTSITGDWLKRAAVYYLARYASSEQNLRRVLMHKVEKRLRNRSREDGEAAAAVPSADEYAALVDETVDMCRTLGLINDRSFAETKISALKARGTSTRRIRQKLAFGGVDRDTIRETTEDSDDSEAARLFARRKKLGPYRGAGTDDTPEQHRKDYAKMARAGFSPDIIREVLGGSIAEDEAF